MSKCYVKAYYDWIEQTAALSDAERGRLFIAILEYARSGREPKLDGREGLLFPVFKCMVDRDNEKSAVLAENGAKGGRGNKANESKQKQNKANESKSKPTKDIRHKTQDEEKDGNKENNIPPIAPQKGAGASAFDWFWSLYPKKADKPAAQRAWKKLKPGEELLQAMLSALDVQKQTDAWTREEGRFIPNPATWLNGRRWEDEAPKVAAPASPKPVGKPVAAQQYEGQRHYTSAEYDALFMDLTGGDP